MDGKSRGGGIVILTNGLVMTEDFKLKRLDVRVEGKKIVDLAETIRQEDTILDLNGAYLLPGFVDTHIHGAYGVRISDAEPKLSQITNFEATQGVTSIAITTAASAFEDILRQIDVAVQAAYRPVGSKIVGIHAEGPFISKKYKGAMNGDYIIAPDKEKLDIMLERAKGLLKIMTVAPEAEGVVDFIQYAVSRGLAISMGHTNAVYDEVRAAIEAGASQTTHTFNAMRGLNHREPGILGAALTSDQVTCEMICDYVHLHPATVQMIYRLKGPERINMISDSGHAAGMNVKEFMVDGLKRYVKDGVVRLADGTIAGSAKTLLDGVINLVSDNIPIEAVSQMVSFNPAKSLKMEHEIGSISIGKLADLVVLSRDLRVDYTFVDGQCIYKNKQMG